MDIEHRFAEIQPGQRGNVGNGANAFRSSRKLVGTLMRYGAIGQGPHGPEVFLPGSFGDISQTDLILNVAHDRSRPLARTGGGGLELVDSHSMMSVAATLPETREASDTLALVRLGILRQLSVEFRAVEEHLSENGVRVISKANLLDLAIVDRGAYEDSVVEARRLETRKALRGRARLATLRGSVPANTKLDCKCSPKDCDEAIFEESSMDDIIELSQPRRRPGQSFDDFDNQPPPRLIDTVLDPPAPAPSSPLRPSVVEPPPAPAPSSPLRPGAVEPPPKPKPIKKRDVVAVEGEYSRPLGATSEGSVRVWPNKRGGIEVAVDIPNTSAGRTMLESASTVNIFARPILLLDKSVFAIRNRVARYRRAWIRGFTLGPSDSAIGWTPLYLQTDEEDDMPDRPEPRQEARHEVRHWEEVRTCL